MTSFYVVVVALSLSVISGSAQAAVIGGGCGAHKQH